MTTPSTVDTAGPAAEVIATLWWWMLALGTIVFAVVSLYLFIAAVRVPPGGGHEPRRGLHGAFAGFGTTFVALWGIAVPAVILTGLMVANAMVSVRTHTAPVEPGVTVEVVGHTFWWEVRYPDHGVLTANEIHIPVGEPVRLVLEASDVIHSFWVPQLHGKMDMIPGETNEFWLEAAKPGEYRGVCAEYCGIQHARMHFVVVAHEQDAFAAWVAARQADPPAPAAGTTAAQGAEVFFSANCAACHTIEALTPYTDAGPALTDLASRRTIAAGMRDNTREELAQWILNPQTVKRGARMPATPLSDDELEVLLDYLTTLAPQDRRP